jgi:hypothetical protein
MAHSGSTEGAFGSIAPSCSLTIASAMPHRSPSHWMHAARLQVLLNRNLFSGVRPRSATSTKAASITILSFEKATVPLGKTIPITLAPDSHRQLGQTIADSDIKVPAFYSGPGFFSSAAIKVVPLALSRLSSPITRPPYQVIGLKR